jgi:Ca2+-binding EF-hand superfamily protein
MASFPRKYFEALPGLNVMSQLLLVANNITGFSEEDREKLKELAVELDNKFLAAVEVFKVDRSADNLVKTLRKMIGTSGSNSEKAKCEYLPLRPEPLNRQNVNKYFREFFTNQLKDSFPSETDIEELAEKSTTHCFEKVDNDRDGLISVPDFNQWIEIEHTPVLQSPSDTSISPVKITKKATNVLRSGKANSEIAPRAAQFFAPALDLAYKKPKKYNLLMLRDVLGLNLANPCSLISSIKILLKNKESIEEKDFVDFSTNLGIQPQGWNKLRKEIALAELFQMLDVNSDKRLDRDEILNSFIVLAGGRPEDKIEALFMLYDRNSGGLISFDEVLRHQQAIFKIIFTTRPLVSKKCGGNAEAFALLVTEAMFQELDCNESKMISKEEYSCWFHKTEVTQEIKQEKQAKLEAYYARRAELLAEIDNARRKLSRTKMHDKLATIKMQTGLDKIHVFDAIATFKSRNASGFFTRREFKEALIELCSRFGDTKRSETEMNDLIGSIFLTFDRDGNGVVDLGEIFCGVSLLCAGSKGEKLKAAFDLFDESGDGFMQFEELVRYLEAIFTLTLQGMRAEIKVPVDHLARATAKNCFRMHKQDIFTGKLSFEMIKEWHDTTSARLL